MGAEVYSYRHGDWYEPGALMGYTHGRTDFIEGERRKCDRYWPSKNNRIAKLENDGTASKIKLTLAEVERTREFVASLIEVEKDGEVREITHIQYLSWPDHGILRAVYSTISRDIQVYQSLHAVYSA